MALRQIRVFGDDILRKKAKPVGNINAGTYALLDDMLETLRSKNGVGLAAPQVGVLRRIAIVEHEDKLYDMINPTIIKSEGKQRHSEACLSVPGKQGDIDRPYYVKVEAYDRHGNVFTVEGKDFLSSVLCHELDHLDGVLYTDRASNVREDTGDERKE
jgi:peptide deformylase